MFYIVHSDKDIWTGRFSSLRYPEVNAAISTRFGGISEGVYSSMNLALHVGDNPEHVIQNRQRFISAIKLDPKSIVTPQQVHGTNIYIADKSDAGRGYLSYDDAIPDTDALITNTPGIPLMLCFADCTPILFYDPVHKAVGIAHGGWRGTIGHISKRTVMKMSEVFDSHPEDIYAAIGPAIGACCYTVGSEVEEEALREYSKDVCIKEGKGVSLDLWKANTEDLLSAGVLMQHIDSARTCTADNSSMFYSYRASGGKTGRHAAVIALGEDVL